MKNVNVFVLMDLWVIHVKSYFVQVSYYLSIINIIYFLKILHSCKLHVCEQLLCHPLTHTCILGIDYG